MGFFFPMMAHLPTRSLTSSFLIIAIFSIYLPCESSATIRWNTDEPAVGAVEYGLTTACELSTVDQPVAGTTHSVLLQGLVPGNSYHYRITASDTRANSISTGDISFVFTGNPGIVSDDFSDIQLDQSVWTFENPMGDASVSMTGTQVEITMPGGVVHVFWTGINDLPRISQAIADEDFEVKVKFESDLTQSFQSQGVLVEQDNLNGLRFEFHQVNGQNKIYAAGIIPTAQNRLIELFCWQIPCICGCLGLARCGRCPTRMTG